MTAPNELELDDWAFVEILDRRLAGRVASVRLGGVPMFQVDVPMAEDPTTFRRNFYGASSIYCLTPASEEQVRAWLASGAPPGARADEMPFERSSAASQGAEPW